MDGVAGNYHAAHRNLALAGGAGIGHHRAAQQGRGGQELAHGLAHGLHVSGLLGRFGPDVFVKGYWLGVRCQRPGPNAFHVSPQAVAAELVRVGVG